MSRVKRRHDGIEGTVTETFYCINENSYAIRWDDGKNETCTGRDFTWIPSEMPKAEKGGNWWDTTKTDKTPNPWPIGGYAPGGYIGMCKSCNAEFIGDKRATQCLECAVTELKTPIAKGTGLFKPVRKKPVTVHAVQLHHGNIDDLVSAIPEAGIEYTGEGERFVIHTLEGKMTADFGDYIIRGVNGEYYPCKAEIFYKTYEE